MHTVVVAILDRDTYRLGMSLDQDTAMTLIAVTSEDPGCWEDIAAYWPRYQTPMVPEFADSLPMATGDFAAVRRGLDRHETWVVIDLVRKRIVTGRGMEPIGRDQAFAMVVDESGKQHCPLSIHLPPWWEMHEQTDPSAVDRERESPLAVPRVNREVLFGAAMIEDFSKRILDVIESDEWRSSVAAEDRSAWYEFTKQVHRDWLMTPRQDLGGLMPRQMLHGALDWIDHLVWAQRLRYQDGGEIVAVPTSVSGYDHGPMGREEMAMYFDLCRELIAAGWQWCADRGPGAREVADRPRHERDLAVFLQDMKQQWLDSPFEGGSPPRFIIECSRRRVPRAAGVPIAGLSEREAEQHMIDCDCPICNLMAEGSFGPAFVGIDGHHLELDNEFAFSMCETRQEWEAQQREFDEMSAFIAAERAERQAGSEAGSEIAADDFEPVWSGNVSDEPLPGDPRGHMKLAFLLAEIVGILQLNGASPQDIKKLNECFIDFRRCDRTELRACGTRLGEHLEAVASRYPELIPRAADFQSRVEEQI